MKIKQDQLNELRTDVNAMVKICGGWANAKRIYENGNFPNSENVNDLQKRFAHDMFTYTNTFIGDNKWYDITTNFNSSHIYTAMIRIVPTVTRKY
jgi:hypothetical protein